MSVCVGCGLHVNAGILEVQLCGDGGIKCATSGAPSPTGCTDGLYVDQTLGCGLQKNAGQLSVKTQGQGTTTSVLADVNGTNCPVSGNNGGTTPTANPYSTSVAFNSGCQSPNCNGLVCTADGMWAPPSLGAINFSCGEIFLGSPGPLSNLTQSAGAQNAFFEPIGDGFAGTSTDVAYGTAPNRVIIVNAFDGDPCNPLDAMSWTAFNINYIANPGELWRWTLWERICIQPTPADVLTQTCGNTAWVREASQYIDFRGENVSRLVTVQINDNSTWRFAKGQSARMEAMISFNRLEGTGPLDNTAITSTFQYRNMGFGYHHQLPQNCQFRDTTL